MRRWMRGYGMVTLVVVLWGCGGTTEVSVPVEDTSVDAVGTDEIIDDLDADASTDTVTVEDATDADVAVDTPCTLACQKWQQCVPLQACLDACKANPCAELCVADPAAKTCESAADCLGLWKDGAPWRTDGVGSAWRTTAADPLVPTDEGTLSLEELWNGRNVFVFFLTQEGFAPAAALWKSNLKTFLKASPTNVHYTFFALPAKDTNAAQALVDQQKTKVAGVLATMTAREQCQWSGRLHFANAPVQLFGGPLFNLVKAMGGQLAMGVDRFQQWRQMGLLQTVGGQPDLKLTTYEPRYWNWEVQRELELAQAPELVVPLHAAKDGAGFDLEVQLPDASKLAEYDTLLIDLGAWCKDHKDENCAEWDYIASASLCERPLVPVVDQPCAATETQACQCTGLDGAAQDKQASCKADGSGFEACPCGCTLEIARWITPYHREGRWVSDITPALTYLQKGGKQRIRFDAANLPMADLSLRFQKRGSPLRPVQIIDVFGGGPFHQDYNKKYVPQTVTIPKATKKVELYAFITGHGYGTELDNCAEFCNHTHHYTVNGKAYVHENPVAGAFMGCAEAVDKDGAVPNQFGTWNLGRGGWCPGQDVKPYRVDVTKDAIIGGENTLTYKGLFKGADYVPKANPNPQGGFGASINMRTWLVLYQ